MNRTYDSYDTKQFELVQVIPYYAIQEESKYRSYVRRDMQNEMARHMVQNLSPGVNYLIKWEFHEAKKDFNPFMPSSFPSRPEELDTHITLTLSYRAV